METEPAYQSAGSIVQNRQTLYKIVPGNVFSFCVVSFFWQGW